MKVTLRDRALCAVTAYCEADSGTAEERELIIHSIFNRVASGKWFGPPSPAAVVLVKMQYSEWNGDVADAKNLARGLLAGDDDPIMQDCYAMFDRVAARTADPLNGATHFYARKVLPPVWTKAPAILERETENFRFYRNVA